MLNNEKAPVAANEQGARELSQANLTTDWGNCQEPVDPVVAKMATMAKRMGLSKAEVSEDLLFNAFSFGSYDVDGSGRYSARVGGVEFFCMVEKTAPPL